ncbi:MAG: hypothetical protein JEY79_09555 [Pseudodesulfovibrio sp.]|nr:hypothetical protein [Pseudodesulfovibrio sp.]
MGRILEFEYWPEILIILVMLTVLILDIALFDNLWPYGDDGGQSATAVTQAR